MFSLGTDGNPVGGDPGPGLESDWGYSSYYRTEAGEIWGPVLLVYTSHGEWRPIYGVNQSGGYSRGPITVVNFGERSLMYFSDEYSTWNYRPYGYYSSPWP